jgi:putative ABC transport system ATP-binding protein
MTLLQLQDVVKHYRGPDEPVRAVDGVSLSVAEGEMIALHGPSGSGKTTLLLLIAALLAPDSGEIRFRDEDLHEMSEARASEYLRRDIGFIHQGAQLMPHVSALENAAVKLLLDGVGARRARRRARPWLERLGLGERLRHTPEQLSGGERQRVSIARALAGEPALILADEPTGNLDTRRSVETVALLREIAHEHARSVLLVTHDREAAALADRVYALRDGRLEQALPRTPAPGAGAGAGAATERAPEGRASTEPGTAAEGDGARDRRAEDRPHAGSERAEPGAAADSCTVP